MVRSKPGEVGREIGTTRYLGKFENAMGVFSMDIFWNKLSNINNTPHSLKSIVAFPCKQYLDLLSTNIVRNFNI